MAIVREKLAIAYQQIDRFEQAIDHWKGAIAFLEQVWRFPEGGTVACRTRSNIQPFGALIEK
ncbi:MAG: hypothetical protein HC789_22760 [Microcoleus sp. CSU_2_2]|nr:hypothetical protein [Microcoleus sp. SU_5_3]NJS12986.1 hypothetical protein [Microcoleus sp. CSU_2_2]